MSSFLTGIRERIGSTDIPLRSQPDFAPVPDSYLLNLANVRNAEGESSQPKSKSLFGPLVEEIRPLLASAKASRELPLESQAVDADIVQDWVDKSKDNQRRTTTLQLLANLKTFSLRLSPLDVPSDSADGPRSTSAHDAPHALEFEYDCDAAKSKVTVDVSTSTPASVTAASSEEHTAFTGVFDGGFSRKLTIEDGAVLEIAEYVKAAMAAAKEQKSAAESGAPLASTSGDGLAVPTTQSRKRLTAFPFKRRNQSVDVRGPSLRVVDEEAVTLPLAPSASSSGDADQVSVSVKITVEALNASGTPLSVPNLQITKLIINEHGRPASETEEDSRHWTVKVVRRDATIGKHSFRLQDIYGLSSSAKSSAVPAQGEDMKYPPTAPVVNAAGATDDSNMQSECVLCLSSPREVVLLPCRHLVACIDCAQNMVEFGAGNAISQGTEDSGPTAAEPSTIAAAEATGAVNIPIGDAAGGGVVGVPAPAAASARRRKRKAKGWSCPICRQPYTSMLRLTRASNAKPEPVAALPTTVIEPSPNTNAEDTSTTASSAKAGSGGGGGLAGMLMAAARPPFLRALSSTKGGGTTSNAASARTSIVGDEAVTAPASRATTPPPTSVPASATADGATPERP